MVTLKASSATNLAFGRAGKDADVIVQVLSVCNFLASRCALRAIKCLRLQLNERLKAVQAENQLLGRLLKDFQVDVDTDQPLQPCEVHTASKSLLAFCS